jgi:hypothetical protein
MAEKKYTDIILPREIAESLAGLNGHGNPDDIAGLIGMGAQFILSGYNFSNSTEADCSDGVSIPIKKDLIPSLRGVSKLTTEIPEMSPLGGAALQSANELISLCNLRLGNARAYPPPTQLEVDLTNNFTVRFRQKEVPILFLRKK